MPGSGKSTVGKQLARQLARPFVDSDHEIERRIGMPIKVYFERQGEDAFRDLEQSVIAELAQRQEAILATGGGAVIRPDNRRSLAAGGPVIYLRSTPEELYRRLPISHRLCRVYAKSLDHAPIITAALDQLVGGPSGDDATNM